MSGIPASRIISGTWGQLWLDGELVAECYGLQAKFKYNKDKVNLCGQMAVDYKITSMEGTGSMRLNKVYTRMAVKVGSLVSAGQDPRFIIISKLADPAAYGAERVVLKNVSFDDETVADWEANKRGQVECPFTFTEREYLDTVEPK